MYKSITSIAKAKACNDTKQDLDIANNGNQGTKDFVKRYNKRPNATMNATFQMQFQIDANG